MISRLDGVSFRFAGTHICPNVHDMICIFFLLLVLVVDRKFIYALC